MNHKRNRTDKLVAKLNYQRLSTVSKHDIIRPYKWGGAFQETNLKILLGSGFEIRVFSLPYLNTVYSAEQTNIDSRIQVNYVADFAEPKGVNSVQFSKFDNFIGFHFLKIFKRLIENQFIRKGNIFTNWFEGKIDCHK